MIKRGKLLLFIFCIVIISFGNAHAKGIYIVKRGDSFYRISKKFNVSVEELRQVNNIEDNKLKPGTKLVIPSERGQKKGRVKVNGPKEESLKAGERKDPKKIGMNAQKTSKAMVGRESTSFDTEGPRFHIVKKGDTLSSIARKYGLSVSDLKEINDIRSKKLRIGQKILLKRTGPRTYIVKKGDNIWKVAKRFNMDAEDLKELNELDSDELKPGQKLVLEARIDERDLKRYEAVISELKVSEDIKALSESDITGLGLKDRVVLFAKKMLNVPYRFGGSSFMGIDCSAYVQKVFGLLNIPLPRSAREQFAVGESIKREELNIGDLVFFRTYASFPSHVGIYLGNNLFIHASSRSKKVTIDSLDTPYYLKRFIGAKRIISDENSDEEMRADN